MRRVVQINVVVTLTLLCIFMKGFNFSTLEVVTDDELLNLVRTEKYVVVLFTKKDCDQCDSFENELTHLREDLVDTLNAWVVKAVSSQLVRIYSPNKEPALVFFRHGIPLLYDGPANDELILRTFTENKEPIVRELSDDNFEHLTQASSGATTGDWFLMFYSTDCVECQRLQARWEAVGAKLRTRLNVARVNRQTVGAVTARRFGVWEVPKFIFGPTFGKVLYSCLDAFVVDASDYSGHLIRHLLNASEAFPTEWFLRNKSKSGGLSPPDQHNGDYIEGLFRQGYMYRYNIHKYDVASFTAFATDWYKNARKETVPVPKSPFDDFLQMIVDYLWDNRWIWKIGFGSLGFTVLSIYIIISKLKGKPVTKKSKKSS